MTAPIGSSSLLGVVALLSVAPASDALVDVLPPDALLEAGGDGDRDAGLLLEASQAELTPHLRTPGAALSGQISLSRASSLSQLSIPHILASIS
jgi:hypothetical protein